MDYDKLNDDLERMLCNFGRVVDARLQSICEDDFKKSVFELEQELEREYFNIEQIKMESLKDAMNERTIYV